MENYVDECMIHYGDSLKVLVLTGGECFLLGNDLNLIIDYASRIGLSVRVVTNGYWAKSPEIAKEKLLELSKCGLKEVNFSTGEDHQFKDFMKIWLFVDGPQKILKYIYEKRGINNTFIGHNCAICAEIFKDYKNIQCIFYNCNDIITSVMLKYNIILRKIDKTKR